MSKTPSHYKENIPRVSDIVSFYFPFRGTDGEMRFEKWLREKGISVAEYMHEASTAGTYIHKMMELYLLTGKFSGKRFRPLINHGIEFLKTLEIRNIETEKHIHNKNYQGTIDLICEIKNKETGKWEKWLLDYKSWGVSKEKFGIGSVYKKPYDKLKKASLQLSLYAKQEKIKNIAVIELTSHGTYFHKLNMWSTVELNGVIREYKLRKTED